MITAAKKWAEDNRAGREEADALIDKMQSDGCPLEFVRRLDSHAQASGHEIGLFNRIAERLLLVS
ncbi:hypothetical protein [uncultured Erythrobacter sp.]|uniref:hypothetical protein n=1 Tax=uncultured Erythrobacter sp. TaxID=263913 RepID=UPI00261518D4|nr:hypothetical protein [uncultured Erythrobacter sp.]